MKYQQCEWCEAKASRKFTSRAGTYIRYACSKIDHADRVRRLMSNDGVTAWAEIPSEVPFEIDGSQNKGLAQPDPLGQTK